MAIIMVIKNGLTSKLLLISNLMTSETGQQIIVINVLLNISRSKGNQVIQFGLS